MEGAGWERAQAQNEREKAEGTQRRWETHKGRQPLSKPDWFWGHVTEVN